MSDRHGVIDQAGLYPCALQLDARLVLARERAQRPVQSRDRLHVGCMSVKLVGAFEDQNRATQLLSIALPSDPLQASRQVLGPFLHSLQGALRDGLLPACGKSAQKASLRLGHWGDVLAAPEPVHDLHTDASDASGVPPGSR